MEVLTEKVDGLTGINSLLGILGEDEGGRGWMGG